MGRTKTRCLNVSLQFCRSDLEAASEDPQCVCSCCDGVNMAVPAGSLVDGDAEVLSRCHSGKRLTVDIALQVRYFLISRDGQPGTFCCVHQSLHPGHKFCSKVGLAASSLHTGLFPLKSRCTCS